MTKKKKYHIALKPEVHKKLKELAFKGECAVGDVIGLMVKNIVTRPAEASWNMADILSAGERALTEMCNTVAPRSSFTDAVDALDAALHPKPEDEG